MKLKKGFIMRKIAGKDIVLPSGDELNLNTIITLNETAKFIWECLENDTTEDEITRKITAEYRISYDEAADYVKEFIETIRAHGFIDES